MNFGPEGTKQILEALAYSGANLKIFVLEAVNIRGDEESMVGVEALKDYLMLESNERLEALYLDDNDMGDGIKDLAPAFADMPILRKLSLRGNCVDEEGAKALVKHKIEKLALLDLDDNADIPKETADELQELYKEEAKIIIDDMVFEEQEIGEGFFDNSPTNFVSANFDFGGDGE